MQEYVEILTMEQAAEMLQVSTRTIQRMVKEGRMPGRQIGSQWRFEREQLREWVRGCHDWAHAPTTGEEQLALIEQERARLGVDLPETLIELQQAAVRRLAAAERIKANQKDE
ncbi:hypothetical protein DRQ50_13445 [bacterium]|nr:MAG: hypothetical protein DRQ50_13445 [bacterium]